MSADTPPAGSHAGVALITFLFTDIEGSTRLVAELGDAAYGGLLDVETAIVERAVAEVGGRVFGSEGDAHFAELPTAAGGVQAAAAIQRALAAHSWPSMPVRVRIGVHAGQAQRVGDDFVGLEVHRAARIAAAAHGGQVIVSDAVRRLAGDAPGSIEGLAFLDLGEHRLKDLAQPERLHQLVGPGLADTFPPLRTLEAAPNNLPPQLTSFVGRAEVAEASRLLDGARLLTLTGPGGTGKTRLSVELAGERVGRQPGGVWFVPLATVTDADLVASAIATTIGLVAPGRPPLERVIEHLRDRDALLVLDNLEQVPDAAPVIATILREAPRVRVLATSRAPLHVYGEQEFGVPPLGLPDAAEAADPDRLMASEAARLFVERALAVRPDFALTPENARAIGEIVHRLDGLPLAIELAAARVRVLSVGGIAARLSDRLGLLTGGARDLPERQRTLRGAIAWSHDLLPPPERRLFARLAVFVGGGDLTRVEEICGPADALGGDVLDALGALAEQSLVRVSEDPHGDARFAMLETIREYAVERLVESGDAAITRERHAASYLVLAESLAGRLFGPGRREALDRYEEDHDNLRAALAFRVEQGDCEAAAALLAAVWRFWQARGHVEEGRARADAVLDLTGWPTSPRRARITALDVAGGLAYWAGDIVAANAHYREQLELARAEGDARLIADALYDLAFAPVPSSDPTRWFEEFARLSGAYLEEALTLYRDLHDETGVGWTLWALGTQAAYDQRPEVSERLVTEALATFEASGDVFGEAWARFGRAEGRVRGGRLADAADDVAVALERFRTADDVSGLALAAQGLATALLAFDPVTAHRIAGLAERAVEESGARLAAVLPAGFEPVVRKRDDPVLDGAWREGRSLQRDEAFEAAIAAAREAARRYREG